MDSKTLDTENSASSPIDVKTISQANDPVYEMQLTIKLLQGQVKESIEKAERREERIEKISTNTHNIATLGFIVLLVTVLAMVLSQINNFDQNAREIKKELDEIKIQQALNK